MVAVNEGTTGELAAVAAEVPVVLLGRCAPLVLTDVLLGAEVDDAEEAEAEAIFVEEDEAPPPATEDARKGEDSAARDFKLKLGEVRPMSP